MPRTDLPVTTDSPVGSDPWAGLVANARSGNARALNRLMAALRPWLTGVIGRRLPVPLVEDVVQESLIAIHLRLASYDASRPFRPWAAAIARHKGIDQLRRNGRMPTITLGAPGLEQWLATPDHESAATSAMVIEGALDAIKPARRAVIRLVKLEGHSIEDAATATGQSGALVKVNIHRGLHQMRVLLAS